MSKTIQRRAMSQLEVIAHYNAIVNGADLAEEAITSGERGMFKSLDDFRDYVVSSLGFDQMIDHDNLKAFLKRNELWDRVDAMISDPKQKYTANILADRIDALELWLESALRRIDELEGLPELATAPLANGTLSLN